MNSRTENADEDRCAYDSDGDPGIAARNGLVIRTWLDASWNVVAEPEQAALTSRGRGKRGEKDVAHAERIEESSDAIDDNRGEVGDPGHAAKAPGITDRHTHAPDDAFPDDQNGSVVSDDSDDDEPNTPEPVWLQALNDLGPVSEVADAGIEEIPGSRKQIEAHGDEKEETQCGARVARRPQQKPEDKRGS